MKNEPSISKVQTELNPLSAALPAREERTPESLSPPVTVKAENLLDVELSTNLRGHSQPSTSEAVPVKTAKPEAKSFLQSADVVTRLMNWIATALKKLERKLLARFENLPLFNIIIAKREPPKEDERDAS